MRPAAPVTRIGCVIDMGIGFQYNSVAVAIAHGSVRHESGAMAFSRRSSKRTAGARLPGSRAMETDSRREWSARVVSFPAFRRRSAAINVTIWRFPPRLLAEREHFAVRRSAVRSAACSDRAISRPCTGLGRIAAGRPSTVHSVPRRIFRREGPSSTIKLYGAGIWSKRRTARLSCEIPRPIN